MSDTWRSPCGRMELRLGRWQDVLGDVTECDTVIADPPYSERTHAGYRTGGKTLRNEITYKPITTEEIVVFSSHWPQSARQWIVIHTDHNTWPLWRDHMEDAGQYVFAPVGWVKPNGPRLSGDGPSVTVEWVVVSRPRRRVVDPRSRPGHYMVDGRTAPDKMGSKLIGQKPLRAIRKMVSDYSRPGDLIVDPYAGSGTTFLAAAMEGRRAIGAEMDPKTYALAVKRLSKGYTERLFREGIDGEQQKLLI